MNNIKPININSNDDFAKFEIKFNEKEKDIFKNYSFIKIILIDNKSISLDFHCLWEDNDKYEIEKRNISWWIQSKNIKILFINFKTKKWILG